VVDRKKMFKLKRNDNSNKSNLTLVDREGVSITFKYVCDFDNLYLLFKNEYDKKLYVPKSNVEILEIIEISETERY
jgi:uncharacterized protein YrzB (UPF0473 family)